MKERIIKEIKQIEEIEKIKIWYAVESGSRAWGFPSTDSDYDVRFIYTREESWYLSVEERRDVIEYPINDLLDISGWDLKKTLVLLRKSNPSLIEWLVSPIVYKNDGGLAEELAELIENHVSLKGLIYHYLHMAKGNYRDYLIQENVKIKKYFYVLRPVFACMYIEKYREKPPILFTDFLKDSMIPEDVILSVEDLLKRKISGEELNLEKRNDILNEFIVSKIAHFEEVVSGFAEPNKVSFDVLNEVFRKYITID